MKKLLTALLLAAPLSLHAGDDFGLWTGVAVQKDISKKFSAEASLDFRAEDKLRRAARWDLGLGASYKPFKFLSFGVGYDYIYQQVPSEAKEKWELRLDDDDEPVLDADGAPQYDFKGYNLDHAFWRSKHRFSLSASGKVDVGRFTFSLRERYQYTRTLGTTCDRDKYRGPIPPEMLQGGYAGEVYEYGDQAFTTLKHETDTKHAKTSHYLRSRIGIDYNINHCPVDPFASIEWYNNLKEGLELNKQRIMVGAEWKITKKHRIEAAYLYQSTHGDDDDEADLHAITLSYKFKF